MAIDLVAESMRSLLDEHPFLTLAAISSIFSWCVILDEKRGLSSRVIILTPLFSVIVWGMLIGISIEKDLKFGLINNENFSERFWNTIFLHMIAFPMMFLFAYSVIRLLFLGRFSSEERKSLIMLVWFFNLISSLLISGG